MNSRGDKVDRDDHEDAAKPQFRRDWPGFLGVTQHAGYEFRRDVRRQRAEIRHNRGDWKLLDDDAENDCRIRIEQQCDTTSNRPDAPGWNVGETRWHQFVGASLYHNRTDPFLDEYLANLRAKPDEALLDRWLSVLFKWETDADLVSVGVQIPFPRASATRHVPRLQTGRNPRPDRPARVRKDSNGERHCPG